MTAATPIRTGDIKSPCPRLGANPCRTIPARHSATAMSTEYPAQIGIPTVRKTTMQIPITKYFITFPFVFRLYRQYARGSPANVFVTKPVSKPRNRRFCRARGEWRNAFFVAGFYPNAPAADAYKLDQDVAVNPRIDVFPNLPRQ